MDNVQKPYIYEFDLKGFFDEVDLDFLYKTMVKDLRVPRREAVFFRKLNRSLVKLAKDPSEDKLPERDRSVRYTDQGLPNPSASGLPPARLVRLDLASALGDPDFLGTFGLNPARGDERSTPLQRGDEVLETELNGLRQPTSRSLSQGMKKKGVPQGAATSCGLSTISLSHITEPGRLRLEIEVEGVVVVMYADDGVIFLEKEEHLGLVLALFERTGVSINYEKSRWIKKNGEWLTDLKFCGIKYSGKDETIRAATRNGATLEFGLKEQFLAFLLEKREQLLLSGSAGHLNSLESYRGISVKSWVLSELTSFLSVRGPQSLLFKGR